MHYAGQLQDEMIEYRRDLHAHPELMYDVFRTSNKVADLLEEWGSQYGEMSVNISEWGWSASCKA